MCKSKFTTRNEERIDSLEFCKTVSKEEIVEFSKYTKENILNKLKNKLMPIEIPKKVFFVESLPLNDSEKIDKKKIKEYIIDVIKRDEKLSY